MKKTMKNFEKPPEEDVNEFFGRFFGIGVIIIGLIIILMTNIR